MNASDAAKLARAAARAGARVVWTEPWAVALFASSDAWGPARLLCALLSEDADDPRVVADAKRIAAGSKGREALRRIQEQCRHVLPFAFESGEVFDGAGLRGEGDCDDQARWIGARAAALGMPVRLGFLVPDSATGPAHVWAEARDGVRWLPIEATVDAMLGEDPVAAARRLGAQMRPDLAAARRLYMAPDDLPPLPPGYSPPWPEAQIERDERALAAAGHPVDPPLTRAAAREHFRRAVLAFQTQHGLTPDGLIGPQTRAQLAAVAHPVKLYTHRQARADLRRAAELEGKTLTYDGETIALGTAHGETFYGRGASKYDPIAAEWAHLDQFGTWARAGGLNWGAIEYDHRRGAENPGPYFQDLHPRGAVGRDGRSPAGFYLFDSDVTAARAFLRTWGQKDTLEAANRGDVTGVAEAMRRHGYYTGHHCGPSTRGAAWCKYQHQTDAEAHTANVAAYAALIRNNAARVGNPDAGPHDTFQPRGSIPVAVLAPGVVALGVGLSVLARYFL